MTIKDITNLEDSLLDHQESLLLDGLDCKNCGQINTTFKRRIILKLPNIIVFQLQRFKFDMYG